MFFTASDKVETIVAINLRMQHFSLINKLLLSFPVQFKYTVFRCFWGLILLTFSITVCRFKVHTLNKLVLALRRNLGKQTID